MTWTRLVNMDLNVLEEYNVDGMPPYLAASHAWSDNLFPVNNDFNETQGGKMIQSSVRMLFPDILHCWIDTICIDQSSEKDKERQIPLMGHVYGQAQAVVVVTTSEFQMTQGFLDDITKDLEEAMYIASEELYTDDLAQYWQCGAGRQKIVAAMDCLEVFTRTRWADRIWTLQEYVLAGQIVWLGIDNVPLQINDILFVALPDLCDVFNIEEALGSKYRKLYAFYSGMAACRLKKIDRTRIMELLGNRTASYPDDEIYGAMAASGVIIQPGVVFGKENVWRVWWEEALRQGHHRWLFLPPVLDARIGSVSRSGNCIMPSFSSRHKASQNSGLDTICVTGGAANVVDGSVTLDGRWAGSCKISRRLGRVHEDTQGHLHRDVTLILFADGSWQLAIRIASAFGGGRYSWKQVLAIAQVLQANYNRAVAAIKSGKEQHMRLRRLTRYQTIVWSDFMQLAMSQMPSMNDGIAYLAQIQNGIKSTDIIVVTDDYQPRDGLHALDFGVKNTSERTTFMIVALKETHRDPTRGVTIPSNEYPLHKIGMSLPIIVCSNVDRARAYKCHAVVQNLFKFTLGGCFCCTCREIEQDKQLSTSDFGEIVSPRQQYLADLIPKKASYIRHVKRPTRMRR